MSQQVHTPMGYVACDLRQPLHSQIQNNSWGMWISLHGENKNILVLANIQHHIFDARLQWSWTTTSPPDINIIWNRSYGGDLWKQYFAMLPPVHDQKMSSRALLSGDVILSINGLPISAFGGSMANVTNYLRQCPRIFIIAARSLSPMVQALHDARKQVQFQEQLQSILKQISILPLQSVPHPIQNSTSCVFTQPQPHQPSRVVTPMTSDAGPWGKYLPHHVPIAAVTPENYLNAKVATQSVYKAHCTKPKKAKQALTYTSHWRNPMFRYSDAGDPTNAATALHRILYDDNIELDPEDGTRSHLFISKISSSTFSAWLKRRKQSWRCQWDVPAAVAASASRTCFAPTISTCYMPVIWTNPMFTVKAAHKPSTFPGNEITNAETESAKNQPLPFSDNFDFDPFDGSRAKDFIVPVDYSNWKRWLISRKRSWRSKWNVYEVESAESQFDSDQCQQDRLESSVRCDFWADRYSSFDVWLAVSTIKWKKSYSWNTKKRKRIQQECEAVVHFPSSDEPHTANLELANWLHVRKNQWRLLRRRRQRQIDDAGASATAALDNMKVAPPSSFLASADTPSPDSQKALVHLSGDLLHIDALLEEEERKKKMQTKMRLERAPIDISFLFLPSSGCPDDVVAHCIQYLEPFEHGKLLCINKKLATGLKSRSGTWQQLCPSRWSLPRRPRKPWHEMYLYKLRLEATSSRKQWDDLVSRISEVLLKGDQLKVVQKLIHQAENKFSFTVDYCSGVVCERNSILNLAVIHERQKVVHWLVEEKNADIETSDRGHFTPLINAAWAGNRPLVRFLLSHGADRTTVGTGHYTEALAPVDFEGLTAEGWARRKGFHDIAELIRVGL